MGDILQPHVIPFLDDMGLQVMIQQQDNARPHSARLTRDFLDEDNISVAVAAYSPDHLWDHLGRHVAAREPMNRPALIRILRGVGHNLPM